jgi:hypothetical protein
MLAWSSGGAVTVPTTVQIRVQRSYPGRIRGKAPVPTRSMDAGEIADNLRHFTVGLDTPRSTPCTSLVLSGVGVAGRPDTPDAIDLAHSLGMSRVVLHAGVEDLESMPVERLAGKVTELVVPVQPGSLVEAGRLLARATADGFAVVANTVLSEQALGELEATARILASARPAKATLTYPFPVNGADATSAPPPQRAVSALRAAVDTLERAGVAVAIKGLPACYLGSDWRLLARSHNRWYVDADHQKDEALLFFPTVVAFHKDEVCRFCALDDRCDGFFAAYLHRPGTPPLSPVETVLEETKR